MRYTRRFGMVNDAWIAPDGTRTCRVWCFDALVQDKTMIDPSAIEQAALDHAGGEAGEYLDTLGKTDLARMSVEEWAAFINVVCWAYQGRISQEADLVGVGLERLRRNRELAADRS